MRGDFRLFTNDSCEWGDWEDNSYFENPKDRNGACAYFDAWKSCGALQFRIWHIDKDLHIELKGEGFKMRSRKRVYYQEDDGEGNDTSCYCTTIVFRITNPQGKVEVVIPSETLYQDECSIRWDEQYIYDLNGRKAHLDIKAQDHYEIKEILSVKQRQHYALQDRYHKLKSISRKMGRVDILRELDMAWISGDFNL